MVVALASMKLLGYETCWIFSASKNSSVRGFYLQLCAWCLVVHWLFHLCKLCYYLWMGLEKLRCKKLLYIVCIVLQTNKDKFLIRTGHRYSRYFHNLLAPLATNHCRQQIADCCIQATNGCTVSDEVKRIKVYKNKSIKE